jgi:hypothetical protein
MSSVGKPIHLVRAPVTVPVEPASAPEPADALRVLEVAV